MKAFFAWGGSFSPAVRAALRGADDDSQRYWMVLIIIFFGIVYCLCKVWKILKDRE